MTKKEILHDIAKVEINRLQKLTNKDLLSEYNCWFNSNNTEANKYMVLELINDFMTYRESESILELNDYLKS